MRTVGGDIEDVIYSAMVRERDYFDLPADEARTHEAIPIPEDAFPSKGTGDHFQKGKDDPAKTPGQRQTAQRMLDLMEAPYLKQKAGNSPSPEQSGSTPA